MAGSITLNFNDDGSVTWSRGSGGGTKGKGRFNWIDEPECPVHGRWEWVPPGNRKDGSAYKGFWTCTNDDCLNRPGRDWAENIDPDAYMAQGGDTGLDDLPF